MSCFSGLTWVTSERPGQTSVRLCRTRKRQTPATARSVLLDRVRPELDQVRPELDQVRPALDRVKPGPVYTWSCSSLASFFSLIFLCLVQVQSGVSSEEHLFRCSSPSMSLLTPAVGQRVLSRLDDGTGAASPEQVMALWREEGLRDSQDVLQVRAGIDGV